MFVLCGQHHIPWFWKIRLRIVSKQFEFLVCTSSNRDSWSGHVREGGGGCICCFELTKAWQTKRRCCDWSFAYETLCIIYVEVFPICYPKKNQNNSVFGFVYKNASLQLLPLTKWSFIQVPFFLQETKIMLDLHLVLMTLHGQCTIRQNQIGDTIYNI